MKRGAIHPAEELRPDLAVVEQCLGEAVPLQAARALVRARAVAWIGSGLSRIGAELGRRTLLECSGVPGTLFTPLDYCASRVDGYLPVLVTYGGKNRDIASAGTAIVRGRMSGPIVLTRSAAVPVARRLRHAGARPRVVAMPKHLSERRYVAIRAAWGLAAMAHRLSGGPAITASTIYERAAHATSAWVRRFCAVEDWRERRWIVLGGAATTPAMIAFEVLSGEAGLASVLRVDIRDFTHGRYNAALREGNAGLVIFADDMDRAIAHTIQNRFASLCPVFLLDACGDPFETVWQHLFAAGLFVTSLLSGEGVTLKRPIKPAAAARWRNWGTLRFRGD